MSSDPRRLLYGEALAEYLAGREPAPVTVALDRVVDQVGEEDDRWLDEVSCRTLERSEW